MRGWSHLLCVHVCIKGWKGGDDALKPIEYLMFLNKLLFLLLLLYIFLILLPATVVLLFIRLSMFTDRLYI